MSRAVALGVLLGGLLAVWAAPVRAQGWRSAQPIAPPPPAGQVGIGVPVSLGHIGDIEFWAPNRGLLITAGNEAVPAGLYAYDGVSWHELSTVCGGSDGRIVWAGPDDFWTISDQQTGQQFSNGVNVGLEQQNRSLCHFVNGQVIASYAEPIGVPGSYQHMDAGACAGTSDCWFAGERLSGAANPGAFHLHWNGSTLTTLPSQQTPEPQLEDPARTVAGLAYYKGRFYESVQVQQSDPPSTGESSSQPYLVHRIAEGSSNPFVGLIAEGPTVTKEGVSSIEPFSYGEAGVQPWQLSALRFGADATQLWAIAGPDGLQPAGANPPQAQPTALLLGANGFKQVKLSDPTAALGGPIAGVAAEPGSSDAWVSVEEPGEPSFSALARVVRIHADGTVDQQMLVPEAGEGLGHKGAAEALACPAQGDCWLATSQGWLFHLGPNYPRDTDPAFQSLITYRPPDPSLPFFAPDAAPEDDSGAEPPPPPPPVQQSLSPPVSPRGHQPLFSHVKARLVHGTTLALTFTLATRSRVRLLALRRKRTVAATRRLILARGRHTLQLHLARRAWPTKLDLQVHALGSVPLLSGSSGEEAAVQGGPTAVSTSYRALTGQLSTAVQLP